MNLVFEDDKNERKQKKTKGNIKTRGNNKEN
jgi:hypothetical protein